MLMYLFSELGMFFSIWTHPKITTGLLKDVKGSCIMSPNISTILNVLSAQIERYS